MRRGVSRLSRFNYLFLRGSRGACFPRPSRGPPPLARFNDSDESRQSDPVAYPGYPRAPSHHHQRLIYLLLFPRLAVRAPSLAGGVIIWRIGVLCVLPSIRPSVARRARGPSCRMRSFFSPLPSLFSARYLCYLAPQIGYNTACVFRRYNYSTRLRERGGLCTHSVWPARRLRRGGRREMTESVYNYKALAHFPVVVWRRPSSRAVRFLFTADFPVIWSFLRTLITST